MGYKCGKSMVDYSIIGGEPLAVFIFYFASSILIFLHQRFEKMDRKYMIHGDTGGKRAGQVSLFLLTGTFFSQFLMFMQPHKTSGDVVNMPSGSPFLIVCSLSISKNLYTMHILYKANRHENDPNS
jgi:hypothetical protein